MATPRKRLAELSTKFVFRIPSWPVTLILSFLIAAGGGIDLYYDSPFWMRVLKGEFAFTGPMLFASIGTTLLAWHLDSPITLKRAVFLSTMCESAIIALIFFSIGLGRVFHLSSLSAFEMVIAILALVFAFRLFVERLLFGGVLWPAVTSASLQPLGTGLMIIGLGMPQLNGSSLFAGAGGAIAVLGIVMVTYGALAMVVFYILDYPLRRKLGTSLSVFIPGFIAYLSGNPGRLESFFADLGRDTVVPVTVLSFQDMDGTEQARFVLSAVHPGPMGEVGGGNLPQKLAAGTDSLVFPFHAMTDHDFNPVTDRDAAIIVETADQAASNITYSETATPGIKTQINDVTALGQAFGDGALLTTTFSPHSTDDVAFSVGLIADAEIRRTNFHDAMVVDTHNCYQKRSETTRVDPHSQKARNIIEATKHTATRLKAISQSSVELGLASDSTPWNAAEGIGSLGIRVAITRVNDALTAYILIDGNNMISGLRERMLKQVSEIDTVEILTTDTHAVNQTTPSKRVGDDIEEEVFHTLMKELICEAQEDLAPVEVGMTTETAKVRTFGRGRTTQFEFIGALITEYGRGIIIALLVAVLSTTALVFHLLTPV
ncbi:MAG: DUF2070 family protein [Halobacteriaceae archaeon]